MHQRTRDEICKRSCFSGSRSWTGLEKGPKRSVVLAKLCDAREAGEPLPWVRKRREAVESEMKQKRMSTRPETGAVGKRGGWGGIAGRRAQGAEQHLENTWTETVESLARHLVEVESMMLSAGT